MNEEEKATPLLGQLLPGTSLEELSEEEFWDCAHRLAQFVPADVHIEEFLECTVHESRCLIPLSALYEVILQHQEITLLPNCPDWMAGIIAWQGEAIAVINLTTYLTHQPQLAAARGTLLIANHQSLPIGLLVPHIGLTLTIPQEQIQSIPSLSHPLDGTFTRAEAIQGVHAGAYLLNLSALLADALRQIEMATYYG